MKTKREVLEEFAKNGDCENINCKKECPYCFSDKCLDLDLRKIGAMAILRMFPGKTTLEVGTDDLLKQKYEENKQLAKRICELQSDLSKAKTMIEKMKCCDNCKWLERENGYVYCKHTYCAKNLYSEWELAE